MPVVTADGYSFNFNDRVCTFPTLAVDVQELLNNTSEATAALIAQDDDLIADWFGKVPGIRTGLLSEIIFVWLNGWRGKFPDQGGPSFVNGVVTGGSMAAFLGDTISPTEPTQFPLAPADFVSFGISQSIAGVILDIEDIRKAVQLIKNLQIINL